MLDECGVHLPIGIDLDDDDDGMPDDWESARGLDPNTADDSSDDDGDGYTNIEEYLSCIVGEGDC